MALHLSSEYTMRCCESALNFFWFPETLYCVKVAKDINTGGKIVLQLGDLSNSSKEA